MLCTWSLRPKIGWTEKFAASKRIQPGVINTWDSQHLGYINRNEQDKPAGRHFNLKGHSPADMEVLVLEKIHQSDAFYRKEREHVHIQNFDLVRKGLNGKKWLCKLQSVLKISSQNLLLGKLVLNSFWYGTLSILILCYYYDLLSDEGSIKLLKYITDIESMYVS